MSADERPLVIAALSGGVDSAVAAWRLLQQGFRVQGLHMTNWEAEDDYCSSAEDLQSARRVAERLGIALHHVNFADEYADRVFRHFLDEYAAGRTPNPDVLCNREIKFGECLRHARRLGADLLATGHYARVVRTADGRTELHRSADESKDQTYFLHAVPHTALQHAVFPLGDLTKDRVRRLAREAGLHNWDRRDSTGICFIGERPFREFLAGYLPARPGPIRVLDSGETVGSHGGLMHHTPGQRSGLGVGGRRNAGDAPWYVADKDLDGNTLWIVQGHDHPALLSAGLVTGPAHWCAPAPPARLNAGLRLHARLRHRQPLQPCTVSAVDGGLRLDFDTPQRAVAPGQYAVLYDGTHCLGGGVIRHRLPVEADDAGRASA